jgi:hypothetical protein
VEATLTVGLKCGRKISVHQERNRVYTEQVPEDTLRKEGIKGKGRVRKGREKGGKGKRKEGKGGRKQ